MLKINKNKLDEVYDSLLKDTMNRPVILLSDANIRSRARLLSINTLNYSTISYETSIPLVRVYELFLQGIDIREADLTDAIRTDIDKFVGNVEKLDINTLLWFQMNLAYNKVGSFHIAPLTYDDKMVILMANGLFQYTVTVRASYGVNEVTVLFNTNDSGFKIDLLTGAILGNSDMRNFSVYQTVYNQKEIKNVKAEMVKQIKNVDSFGLEETYLKANDDAFTAINKYLKYLIH